MKKLFTALMAALFALTTIDATAGNLDKQPAWGPAGYETAMFYYLPDLNIYYDVANALFYYLSGSAWISATYLPAKYKVYDLYSLYKVVLNDEPKPWENNKNHKKLYKDFKEDKTQTTIRNAHDTKYDASKKNNTSWVDPNRGNVNSQAAQPTQTTSEKRTSTAQQESKTNTQSTSTRSSSSSSSSRTSTNGQSTTRTR